MASTIALQSLSLPPPPPPPPQHQTQASSSTAPLPPQQQSAPPVAPPEAPVLVPAAPQWPLHTPHNIYEAPAASLAAEFAAERERIFIPEDDEVCVTILELRHGAAPRRRELESTADVLAYVRERDARSEEERKGMLTIISIPQTFSWGPLEITAPAAQALFTTHRLSPGFWPVVQLFGCQHSADREAAGGFNELVCDEGAGEGGGEDANESGDGPRSKGEARDERDSDEEDVSFEISYTAKHAEEHHRAERAHYNPFSVRQIGVAQRYDAGMRANTVVLLNPSAALLARLATVTAATPMLDLHRLVLCAVTERWGQYLAHLESVCKDISKKAVLAKGPARVGNRGFDVHFSDAQRIRDLQDTIIHVSHMLDLNLSISENLSAASHLFAATTPSRRGSSSSSRGRATRSSIFTLTTQTKLWKCHAENLLRRLDGSSVLVRSILDAKALETLQASSHTTAELAALAREDALKAKKDARRLNTITILGFVYLPASFVATLLGTQYINIHDNAGSSISVTFAREMWIFAILTVILLTVTAGTWLLWERHNRRADKAEAEKAGKTV